MTVQLRGQRSANEHVIAGRHSAHARTACKRQVVGVTRFAWIVRRALPRLGRFCRFAFAECPEYPSSCPYRAARAPGQPARRGEWQHANRREDLSNCRRSWAARTGRWACGKAGEGRVPADLPGVGAGDWVITAASGSAKSARVRRHRAR